MERLSLPTLYPYPLEEPQAMDPFQMNRQTYQNSLNQLITISCILVGFAFSGLIALPSLERSLFMHIVDYVKGDFDQAFMVAYYALFFSSLCFLSTIMTILIYKVSDYMIPLPKLKRIYTVANLVFSLAISTLLVSVITLGIPSTLGITLAVVVGFGVSFSFIWENMVPWQKRRREEQVTREKEESRRMARPVKTAPEKTGEEGKDSEGGDSKEEKEGGEKKEPVATEGTSETPAPPETTPEASPEEKPKQPNPENLEF